MKIRHLEQFRDERDRFALVHTCEDCVYFDAESGRCAHGYPNAQHRREALETPVPGPMFCKEFELT